MRISEPQLTERQRRILRLVVEEYVTTGQPVGSKSLVERGSIAVSSSTVRNDFAALESRGLLTQPHTSAGRVPTESGYRVDAPVDPGLASWAGEYLNDALAGLTLGSSAVRSRLSDPQLSEGERTFLDRLRPAFTRAADDEQRLYVGGAAGLLDDVRTDELDSYRRLFEVLEKRAALLELMRGSLDPRRPYVRVGEELDRPELADVALVGAAYGLAHRTLGTVGLLGPVRMDYDKAIR